VVRHRARLSPLERVAVALGERSPSALRPLNETGCRAKLRRSCARSMACSTASIAHSMRSARSSPTQRTSCAHRSPQCTCRRNSPSARYDAERSAALCELRAGLERATRLVEQLLTLAREEPGVSERPFGRVNLTELAREVVSDYAPIAPRAPSISACRRLRQATTPRRRRREALRTLASNLIDNALRHTPPAGASTSPRSVTVATCC
jgi:two-component system OmpR family sensor kinase